MTSRRGFLKIVGSSAVILAAGAGGFAATRTPEKALAPWSMAGSAYSEPRMRALSYAILAPNPHNRQSWSVDLKEPDTVVLYCDLDRLLPETDPFDRQITIGLGCFLEVLRMAAAEQGFATETEYFPLGQNEAHLDARPIARIKFSQQVSVKPDPLFKHVLMRRSAKEKFDTQTSVSGEILQKLVKTTDNRLQMGYTNNTTEVNDLRSLTYRAHEIEVITPNTYRESIDLMRIGKAEINANPDGIDLGGPFLESLALVGMMTREQLADPSSSAYQQGLTMYEDMLNSAMAYMWIYGPTNTREDQLNAGRDWVRLNLACTQAGVALHPLSQALQEYPEMADLYRELHSSLGLEEHRIQMFARMGYLPEATTLSPSPRWPAEARVRKGKTTSGEKEN